MTKAAPSRNPISVDRIPDKRGFKSTAEMLSSISAGTNEHSVQISFP